MIAARAVKNKIMNEISRAKYTAFCFSIVVVLLQILST